ncbi:hypothetical protein LEMLEM_LOCUS23785 [Lemmus lemmus]
MALDKRWCQPDKNLEPPGRQASGHTHGVWEDPPSSWAGDPGLYRGVMRLELCPSSLGQDTKPELKHLQNALRKLYSCLGSVLAAPNSIKPHKSTNTWLYLLLFCLFVCLSFFFF